MKSMLATNPENITALVARITLAVVIFPHGAQKLFGWFGGYGFSTTLKYLTGGPDLPWILALMVILIESVGAILVLLGFLSRWVSILVFANFLGIMFHSHVKNGFFMNWKREADTGEGFEFFLLILGLSIILFITGGGKWSVDAAITRPKVQKEEEKDIMYQYGTE